MPVAMAASSLFQPGRSTVRPVTLSRYHLMGVLNHARLSVVGLKALPFTTVHQDGDDGANVLFEVEHFDEVASRL